MNPIPYNIHYEWKIIHDGVGKTPNIRTSTSSWCYNNALWLLCGASSGLGKASEVWKFDLELKLWNKIETPEGSGPNGRDGQTGAYIGNGKFVIFGGQGFAEPNQKLGKESDQLKTQTHWKRDVFNDLWQFDCNTLRWTPIYPDGLNFPMGRRGASCIYVNRLSQMLFNSSALSNEKSNNKNSSKSSLEYDPTSSMDSAIKRGGMEAAAAGTSTSTHSHSSSRRKPTASTSEGTASSPILLENCLVVFGGAGIELSKYTEQLYNDLWIFSFDRNVWIRCDTKGSEPIPVTDHKVYKIDDLMVVIGGILDTTPRPGNPANTTPTIASDIQVLNLLTMTWSFLPLYDSPLREKASRLNLHGFALFPDQVYPPSSLVFHPVQSSRRPPSPSASSPSELGPTNRQVILFGGNQVLDTKTAIHSKGMKALRDRSSQEATLVLNLEEGTLTPLLLRGDLFPENRYLHAGISSTPCNLEINEPIKLITGEGDSASVPSHSGGTAGAGGVDATSVLSGRSQPKAPESNRKSFVPGIGGIDLRTEEIVSYVFGGSNIDYGAYCDPVLYGLYRIKILDPLQLRSANTPSVAPSVNSSIHPNNNTTHNNSHSNHNNSNNNRQNRRFSQPLNTAKNVLQLSNESTTNNYNNNNNSSSFYESNSFVDDSFFPSPTSNEDYEDRDYSTSSIWVNMQNKTKDDYRDKAIRPPNNWEEFKLSLTYSRSQKGLEANPALIPSSSSGAPSQRGTTMSRQSTHTHSKEEFDVESSVHQASIPREDTSMKRNSASRSAARQRQEANQKKIEFMKQSKALPFIQKYQSSAHESFDHRMSQSQLLLDYMKTDLARK